MRMLDCIRVREASLSSDVHRTQTVHGFTPAEASPLLDTTKVSAASEKKRCRPRKERF